MLRIINKNFSSLQPVNPIYNAVCVFNLTDAKLVFNRVDIDFVVVLDENTGTFTKCLNILEVEQFLIK